MNIKNCPTCNKLFETNNTKRIYCRKKCGPSTRRAKIKYRKKHNKILDFRQPISKLYRNEIKEIYKNRPIDMEVDHIIPLNGENVSGLHVPWNLQYLIPEENNRKSNKVY